ncbi:maestro heat-like repeat family member 5 [Harpia harpyja]|uniref:maestro heat-like repeat family member 5 n=1 Tax=Harpia harpyja TaxID=202280 RepID=UPI0022B1E5EE|nr:maestro heat-like repeat family member 5 [Harpia harpyja]
MKVLLEDILKTLQYASEDIQMKALLVFRNILGHMTREEASPIALKLAVKLPPLFSNIPCSEPDAGASPLTSATLKPLLTVGRERLLLKFSRLPPEQASSQLRESSIRLFGDITQMVVWRHRRQMRKNVQRGLLPLLFHMSDQTQSVAKASREALLSAAEFLEQKQLKYLTQTEQAWRIGECLLVQDRNRVEDYLWQSLLYLKDAQATVREEAVRFTGLAARHLRDQSAERLREVCDALKPLQEDIEPSICSLAAQTMLIVGSPRKRPASGWTRALCCWPCKAREK